MINVYITRHLSRYMLTFEFMLQPKHKIHKKVLHKIYNEFTYMYTVHNSL